MRLWGIDREGRRHLLAVPVNLELVYEEETPADRLTATVPVDGRLPACKEVLLETEEQKRLFYGIVDKQEYREEEQGRTALFECRSLAALLTDNEALPRWYQNPRLPQLFAVHAAPYGLTGAQGNGQVFAGGYMVKKGMSQWQAIAGFCSRYLHTLPRVTPDGVLQAGGAAPGERLCLGSERLPLLAFREIERPEKRLSEIRFRVQREDGYGETFVDEEARRMGIRRRKLFNLADGQKASRKAKELFAEGKRAAWRAEALCPGGIFPPLGIAVRVLGWEKRLRLTGIRYAWNPIGETTALFLGEEEEDET